MPPRTSIVDGISKPPSAPFAKPPQTVATPVKSDSKPPTLNNAIQTSAKDRGPVAIIVLTIAVMILLSALAYFAYNKSK